MTEYSGYEAFEYLEEGEDYQSFTLPKGIHNGEPYEVPLDEDDEQRAAELGENSIVISFHEHRFISR
ncbi:hypothetical protein BRC77_01545 [Halobacteriales archaeon QH_8_64_26]|nr:MAG: hypothetical protein BRC77_01545 [Halobacteriales archaeon QH_8_64_26]